MLARLAHIEPTKTHACLAALCHAINNTPSPRTASQRSHSPGLTSSERPHRRQQQPPQTPQTPQPLDRCLVLPKTRRLDYLPARLKRFETASVCGCLLRTLSYDRLSPILIPLQPTPIVLQPYLTSLNATPSSLSLYMTWLKR